MGKFEALHNLLGMINNGDIDAPDEDEIFRIDFVKNKIIITCETETWEFKWDDDGISKAKRSKRKI